MISEVTSIQSYSIIMIPVVMICFTNKAADLSSCGQQPVLYTSTILSFPSSVSLQPNCFKLTTNQDSFSLWIDFPIMDNVCLVPLYKVTHCPEVICVSWGSAYADSCLLWKTKNISRL